MSKDVKLLLLAGVGIAFFAWGLAYSQQFGNLVTSATSGYGNVVKALEPPPSALQQSFNSAPIGMTSGASPGQGY